MELFHNLIIGFGVALSPQNLLYCFIGCLVGTLIGVLPGGGSHTGCKAGLGARPGQGSTTQHYGNSEILGKKQAGN